MATISVRLPDEEKSALEKYGKISDIVRDAIRL
jgi:Arc/MetJ-type ribon-helix-helix transcriptional regulator